MNTKSAVILMIGLLGMPAVFNFTKQMDSPGPRWSVVPVAREQREHFSSPWAILLDNRTGQVRYLLHSRVDDRGETQVTMSKPAIPSL